MRDEPLRSLTLALEGWFENTLRDLPKALRERLMRECALIPWDDLSAEQRRHGTLQLDYQRDPATEKHRQFWWGFFQRKDTIKKQIAQCEAVATPTAADLGRKEFRLAELQQELARMKQQEQQARGDYYPEQNHSNSTAGIPAGADPQAKYVAYPRAVKLLADRLNATPDELAAWVWMGPEHGGLAAYLNANELDPPRRFHYGTGSDNDFDYLSPLMATWFGDDDIARFEPADRFVTGAALIKRWRDQPGVQPEAFIRAKIAESRLLDAHPICGGTQGTYPEDVSWPPLASGLFVLAHVEAIEAEDFGVNQNAVASNRKAHQVESDIGSPEWRRENAQAAANARHSQAGGSREKQKRIREIWACGKYSSRDLCAEQECAALGMSFSSARKALINTPDP